MTPNQIDLEAVGDKSLRLNLAVSCDGNSLNVIDFGRVAAQTLFASDFAALRES